MAQQIIRPDADDTDGNWLNESASATNIYASIDEAPSTVTVYADANGGDDFLQCLDTVYATALAGTGTLIAGSGEINAQNQLSAGNYTVREGFFEFDLSSHLGVTADVELYLNSKVDAESDSVQIASHDYGGGVVTTADWQDGTELSALTPLGTTALSALTESAYNALASNISVTGGGFERYIVFAKQSRDGTTPTGGNRANFEDADNAGTTQDPKISFDAPDDSDYIISGAAPSSDEAIVSLANPSTGVDTTAGNEPIVRYRYRKEGPSVVQVNLTVRLYEGVGGSRTTIATWSHTDIGNSVVQAEQTLSAGETASISNFDDLYLGFEANQV